MNLDNMSLCEKSSFIPTKDNNIYSLDPLAPFDCDFLNINFLDNKKMFFDKLLKISNNLPTLFEENITRMAGGKFGQITTPEEFQKRISSLDRPFSERGTLYNHIRQIKKIKANMLAIKINIEKINKVQ